MSEPSTDDVTLAEVLRLIREGEMHPERDTGLSTPPCPTMNDIIRFAREGAIDPAVQAHIQVCKLCRFSLRNIQGVLNDKLPPDPPKRARLHSTTDAG